jgi:cobyrinic acid a,c-diamide synthase
VGEDAAFQRVCAELGTATEGTVDVTAILAAAHRAPALDVPAGEALEASAIKARIGVARDAAFNFYYDANLQWLRHWGAEVVEFSPLRDHDIPADVDALYFGGGYPEVFAKGLAENVALRRSLRRAHGDGMPIYAECGGLMYLVEAIHDAAGGRYAMVGLLPGTCRLTDRLQSFGYKEVTSLCDSLLGGAGLRTRGHEFHYSVWEGRPAENSLYQTRSSRGDEHAEGYSVDNLTASYVHLHFDACPHVPRSLVDKAVAFRRQRHALVQPSPGAGTAHHGTSERRHG